MVTDPLQALIDIISSGVQTLHSSYAKYEATVPSLDDSSSPGPSELENDPAMRETTSPIVAAAAQLIATVRAPVDTIYDLAPGCYISATLRVTVEAHIAHILKDAGSQVTTSCHSLLQIWCTYLPHPIAGTSY